MEGLGHQVQRHGLNQGEPVGLEVARVAAQRLGIARDVDDPPACANGGVQVEAIGALAWGIEDDGVGRIGGRARRPGRGVGSSRVDLQACKLEYSIVSPK